MFSCFKLPLVLYFSCPALLRYRIKVLERGLHAKEIAIPHGDTTKAPHSRLGPFAFPPHFSNIATSRKLYGITSSVSPSQHHLTAIINKRCAIDYSRGRSDP